MTPKEFHESGMLYHVNETVMWPLGLAFAVTRDTETHEYAPGLTIIDYGEVIQDPSPEIREIANAWLAARYRSVRP